MGGGSLTKQISTTPAGCPTTELNSDTIYPDMTSDPAGEELGPTRLLPTPLRTQITSNGSPGYPQLLPDLAT